MAEPIVSSRNSEPPYAEWKAGGLVENLRLPNIDKSVPGICTKDGLVIVKVTLDNLPKWGVEKGALPATVNSGQVVLRKDPNKDELKVVGIFLGETYRKNDSRNSEAMFRVDAFQYPGGRMMTPQTLKEGDQRKDELGKKYYVTRKNYNETIATQKDLPKHSHEKLNTTETMSKAVLYLEQQDKLQTQGLAGANRSSMTLPVAPAAGTPPPTAVFGTQTNVPLGKH